MSLPIMHWGYEHSHGRKKKELEKPKSNGYSFVHRSDLRVRVSMSGAGREGDLVDMFKPVDLILCNTCSVSACLARRSYIAL